MEKEDAGSVHDRLLKMFVLGLGGVVAYTELRIHFVEESFKDLANRFNEHTSLGAHQGQAESTDHIIRLIYFILQEMGLNVPIP